MYIISFLRFAKIKDYLRNTSIRIQDNELSIQQHMWLWTPSLTPVNHGTGVLLPMAIDSWAAGRDCGCQHVLKLGRSMSFRIWCRGGLLGNIFINAWPWSHLFGNVQFSHEAMIFRMKKAASADCFEQRRNEALAAFWVLENHNTGANKHFRMNGFGTGRIIVDSGRLFVFQIG